MDTSLKIQILLILILLSTLFITFMVIIHTIGDINHIFNRFEEIVTKETFLRFEQIEKTIKTAEEHKKLEMERRRRTEALLHVPLVKEKPKKKDG